MAADAYGRHAGRLLGRAGQPGRALGTALLGAACLLALWPLPGRAQGFVADISPQEFTVRPGELVSGELNVSCTADEPVELHVHLADCLREAGAARASYAYSEELGREARSLAAWTTFSPGQFTLQPGQSASVSFEIRVPADSTLNGSYWVMLFVSNATTAEAVMAEPPAGGVGIGINMLFRFATFLSVTIDGTQTSDVKYSSLDVQQEGAWFNVHAVLQNSGNSVARPSSWLEIRDSAGGAVYTSDARTRYVLPDSSRLVRYEVRKPLAAGEYMVMVIADYGAPKLIAGQGLMSIDEATAKAMQEAYDAILDAEAAAQAAAAEEAVPAEPPPRGPGEEQSEVGAGGETL